MGADAALHQDAVAQGEDTFLLELVAEPKFVSTARLFAATLARQFDCPEDRVQDIKVAISEACSNAIKAHREARIGDPIRILVHTRPRGLTYEVVDIGQGFEFEPRSRGARGDPTELVEGGIGLTLIGALFPGFEVDSAGHGTTLRFTVDLPTGRGA